MGIAQNCLGFLFIFVCGICVYLRSKPTSNSAIVMVLGSIERSPRMQNHVASLLRHNIEVDFIGYKGKDVRKMILESLLVRVHFLPQPVSLGTIRGIKFVVQGIKRTLHQILGILIILSSIKKPRVVLVQNPPSMPTLLVCRIYCFIYGVNLIIDWHNFGFTLLGKNKGKTIIRLFELYEKYVGGSASAHLTVTNAMKNELESWPISGKVYTFYDRPPLDFKTLHDNEKMEYLRQIDFSNENLTKSHCSLNVLSPFELKNGTVTPNLIVSSTSWTEDEDFEILFDALVKYDNSYNCECPLYVIITGKGPLKSYYENLARNLKLENIRIYFAWLSIADYPKLLACADAGISLHTSSSGFDLPMKVVDMLGSGIPAFALAFDWYYLLISLDELIIDGENGKIFTDSTSLSALLAEFFTNKDAWKSKFRNGIAEFQSHRWDESWEKIVLPLIIDAPIMDNK